MNLFGEKKRKQSLVAIFDIASASVGGLLFKKQKGFAPQIMTSIRQPANIPSKKNFAETWKAIHVAFDSVTKYLKKNSPETPSVAFCVFSSPWYVSQTKIIKVKREKKFEIEKELISELIKDEMRTFKTEWSSGNQTQKKENTFIESVPIKTVLNGYTVKNPLGKKVNDLELYAYLSLISTSLKEKIKDEILTDIHPSRIGFNTFPYVFLNVLRGLVNTKEGAMFIDISGEITDVFIIRNNIIQEINSFSKGENFFIRRIASAFNLNFNEAKFKFLQYQRKELEKTYSEKISAILKPATNEWGNDLKELLNQIAKDQLLPQNLYLCGRKRAVSLKEIATQISGESFAKFTTFNQPFNVKFLLPESLKHHFDFPKGFSGTKDIFLLISALFADKFLK